MFRFSIADMRDEKLAECFPQRTSIGPISVKKSAAAALVQAQHTLYMPCNDLSAQCCSFKDIHTAERLVERVECGKIGASRKRSQISVGDPQRVQILQEPGYLAPSLDLSLEEMSPLKCAEEPFNRLVESEEMH